MNYFKTNLRYLQKTFELKQEDIAAKVNKQRGTISNWQKGVSEPNIDELIILSRYFDIRLDILILINLEKNGLTDEQILEFHKKGRLRKNPVEYDTTHLESGQVTEADEPVYAQVLDELKKLNGNVGKLRIELRKKME